MNNNILFFIKYPQKGYVKTRLSDYMGEGEVVELYRCFISDILDMLNKIRSNIWICYWPMSFKEKFESWLGGSYEYIPQRGDDLGQRLEYCFRQVFDSGARRTLVIGSDCPDIQEGTITAALNHLENHDIAIGPTFDGGYYLLGFRADTFLPQVFDNISWSSDSVFKKTMGIIESHNKSCFILEKRHDVDTVEDLNLFISGNFTGPFSNSSSMKYLKSCKKISSRL